MLCWDLEIKSWGERHAYVLAHIVSCTEQKCTGGCWDTHMRGRKCKRVHTSAPTNTYLFTQGADTSPSFANNLHIDGITGLRQKYLVANATQGSEFSWKCLEVGLSLILSASYSFTLSALGERT